MPQKKTTEQKANANFIYFEEGIVFPSTKDRIIHTIAGYRVDSRTGFLLPVKSENPGVVAAALSIERREPRRKLIEQLFYGSPTHGIRLTGKIRVLPARNITIFNFGLRLEQPGYEQAAILQSICRFILWHSQEIKLIDTISLSGVDFPHKDILTSNHAPSKIYWLLVIVSKYASILGDR